MSREYDWNWLSVASAVGDVGGGEVLAVMGGS